MKNETRIAKILWGLSFLIVMWLTFLNKCNAQTW